MLFTLYTNLITNVIIVIRFVNRNKISKGTLPGGGGGD